MSHKLFEGTLERYPIIKNDGRFSSEPSHSDEEGKRRVSNILTAGIVFPVIPLAMNNVTDLNTVVAG